MTRIPDRQRERRERILRSAQDLLHARGWHAVAIDEIGEASGMTGPAIYRYFANKQELLSEAMSFAMEQLWNSSPPDENPSIEAYVSSHVSFVLDNARLVQLWYREAQNLPPDVLKAHRQMQRRYLERWVEALTERRPELAPAEARLMVRGAVGLVHSVAHTEQRRDRAETRRVLERMTLAALAA